MQHNKFDVNTSLVCADSFMELSLKQIEIAMMPEHGVSGMRKISQVFTSATNMGLAIELYLKTLIIMENNTNKFRVHLLHELYSLLSKATQENLIAKYNQLGGNERKDVLYIAASSSTNNSKVKPQQERNISLLELLTNNCKNFVSFRYMFENGCSANWQYTHFEHGNLELAANAFRWLAYDSLDDKGRTILGDSPKCFIHPKIY